MSIAFLFPGLGAQRPGMLHRLPDTAASATVLADADMALRDQGVTGGIAELDTAESLESPVAVHTALLIAGVAGNRALTEDEGLTPTLVAGFDAGGYAAAVASEVLTFEEALRAVRIRGELLESGRPATYTAVRLAQHLATVSRRPQAVPWVSTLRGHCVREDTNAVFDELAQSVVHPPRRTETASAITGEGAECAVELPPGRTLAELAEAEPSGLPGLRVVSVEEYGIADAAALARGETPGASGAEPDWEAEGWDQVTGQYRAGAWGGGRGHSS